MNTTMSAITMTMTIITILIVEKGADFRVSAGSTALVDAVSSSPPVVLLSPAVVLGSSGSVVALVGSVVMSIVVMVGRGMEVGTEVERRMVVVGVGVAERVRGALVKVENVSIMDEVSLKMVVVSVPVVGIEEESIVADALVDMGRDWSVVTDSFMIVLEEETTVVEGIMSLEVVVGDIGVATVGELPLVTWVSTIDVKGIRISAVEELVADISMVEVIVIELTSAMLGDTVSSGMSTSLISPPPDPDPGPKLV
jgi:hypothetical protein